MGIMDKAKDLAGKAVDESKKAASAAKGKVDDVQSRKKADDLAKELGYLIAKGGSASSEEAQALVLKISEIETEMAGDGAPASTPPEDAGEATS
jgi:hypothetical protein